MHSIKKHIPNSITLGNLFVGCVGITFAFNENLKIAAFCIFLAAFLDFFDGLAARLLKVSSNLGKDLDSLADMVSFGVLPSVILYQMFGLSICCNSYTAYYAFLISIFSAYRLAKFNNDPRQSENFIGIPTPANAAIVATFPLLSIYNPDSSWAIGMIEHPRFLLAYTFIMSYLLVSEIKLLSLKFKSWSFKGNEFRWILILSAIVLIVLLKFASSLPILLVYVLLSKINFKQES